MSGSDGVYERLECVGVQGPGGRARVTSDVSGDVSWIYFHKERLTALAFTALQVPPACPLLWGIFSVPVIKLEN